MVKETLSVVKKAVAAWLMVVWCAQPALAQPAAATIALTPLPFSSQQISPLPFQRLGTAEGLPACINRITQDRAGFIWIATMDGIYRYDGLSFREFKKDPSRADGLASSWTARLAPGPNGSMWAITKRGRLHYFDAASEEFKRLPLLPPPGSDTSAVQVVDFLSDGQDRIWLATSKHGLNRLDPRTGALTRVDLGEQGRGLVVYRMLEGHDGRLWLVTSSHLLALSVPNGPIETEHFEHVPTEAGTQVTQDQAGNIYFANYTHNLLRFHPGSGQLERFRCGPEENPDVAKAILATADGNYWIAGRDGGLRIVDLKKQTVQSIRHNRYDPKSLSSDNVFHLFEDASRGVWVSTWCGGVSYYYPGKARFGHQYSLAHLENSLSSNDVGIFHEDRRGYIWIAAAGLDRFEPDGQRVTRHVIPTSLSTNKTLYITGIVEGAINGLLPEHQFLLGSNRGLLTFDTRTGRYAKWTAGDAEAGYLERASIYRLIVDNNRRLWVITSSFQVYYFDNAQGSFRRYHLPEVPIKNRFGIVADHQGHIWIETGASELYRLDLTTEEWTHLKIASQPDRPFPIYEITSYWRDGRGRQWVCSYQGLYLLLPDPDRAGWYRYRAFTELDGLPDIAIHGMLEDDRGQLWISTWKGLSKMDADHFTFRNYSEADGLQGRRFGYNSYYRSPTTGAFYFGGENGFNVFRSEAIQDDTLAPQVAITDLAVYRDNTLQRLIPNGEENGARSISLTYDDKLLNIRFAALHYAAPAENQYAVQLEGYENDWRPIGRQREATYTNLDAGTYLFKVKAANKDGVWNEQGAALTIVVHPPWWESWWAYLLYLALLTGAAYLLFRLLQRRWQLRQALQLQQAEARRLQELDSFKSRLYTNLTHEFRTPLTVILGMVDQMRESPKRYFDEGTQLIERNGRNLLRLINQLLDLSKLENKSFQLQLQQGDIVHYLRYLTESFQTYANSHNLSLRFSSTVASQYMDYDPEQIKQVLTNLLSNAVKYTPSGGHIQVALSKDKQQLVIDVTDTGIGIAAKDLPHIFDRFYQVDDSSTRRAEGTGIGLAHSQELIRLMGGRLRAVSRLGRGSTFTITLPITREQALSNAPPVVPVIAPPLLVQEQRPIPTAPPAGGERPLLLLIEDNHDVVVYLKACLEDRYRIDVAYNGDIGIDKALETIPDLIISDVMMPQKDGYQVCDTLKNDARTSHIPIILLTAKADEHSRIKGLRRGADAYLVKPFDKEELLVRLQMMVEKQRRLTAYFQRKLLAGPAERAAPEAEVEETILIEDAFLQEVTDILEHHYHNEQFGLAELCQEIGMSRSQLFRKMKALIEQSPSVYIRSFRLRKAKHLLETTDLNVNEVTWETGFSNPTHFSKLFKEEFGVLPSQLGKK